MRFVKMAYLALLLAALPSCSGSNRQQRKELAGFWESTDSRKSATVEFAPDNSVVLSGNAYELLDWKVMRIIRDFKLTPGTKALKFQVVGKDRVEIQGDFTAMLDHLQAGARSGADGEVNMNDFQPSETLSFVLAGNTLTLSSEKGKSISFRRSN